MTVQHEFGRNIVGTVSYEYVHGMHVLRSLDVNLPAPTITEYPVYNDTGSVFLGMYDVASFATWQTTPSATCPYPPCINPVQRPDPQLGAINSFESGIEQHLQRHDRFAEADNESWNVLSGRIHVAKAIDDGPDALVVGRSGNVQNSYATALERGPSVNDQRNRFVAAWVAEPNFHFDQSSAQPAGQQLEAFQRHHRGFRTANQCDHGGRSQWRWQHLQRSPAGIQQERLYRPRLLQHRYASHAHRALRRPCRAGILSPSRSTCSTAPTPCTDQRRWLLQLGGTICRLHHHRRQGSCIRENS